MSLWSHRRDLECHSWIQTDFYFSFIKVFFFNILAYWKYVISFDPDEWVHRSAFRFPPYTFSTVSRLIKTSQHATKDNHCNALPVNFDDDFNIQSSSSPLAFQLHCYYQRRFWEQTAVSNYFASWGNEQRNIAEHRAIQYSLLSQNYHQNIEVVFLSACW